MIDNLVRRLGHCRPPPLIMRCISVCTSCCT
jgi:hypothetical protein